MTDGIRAGIPGLGLARDGFGLRSLDTINVIGANPEVIGAGIQCQGVLPGCRITDIDHVRCIACGRAVVQTITTDLAQGDGCVIYPGGRRDPGQSDLGGLRARRAAASARITINICIRAW